MNGGTNGNVTFNQITNGLGYVPATNINIASVTNGFVDSRITNGLAGTNYAKSVTNNFTTLATSNAATVLFTNALPGLTNGLAGTNYVNSATNGFVDARVTNGYAPTSYVVTVSNTIVQNTFTNAVNRTNGFGTNTFLSNPSITNEAHFGRLNLFPQNGVGLGQLGVDSIDVLNQSDLSITSESDASFVKIIVGGFKVQNGSDQFIVDGPSGITYGNGAGLTNTTATNFGPTGFILITNAAGGITNRMGISASSLLAFRDTNSVATTNQAAAFAQNIANNTSNSLNGSIALKANTNSPNLFNPLILGTNNSFVSDGTAYLGKTNVIIHPPSYGDTAMEIFNDLIVSGGCSFNGTIVGLFFSGNGYGLTNTSTTNLQGTALIQVSNVVSAAVTASTNSLTSLARTNPATVLYTNSLPGLTNNFVDKSITNNAATISLLNTASNALQGQITAGGINAVTGTNITAYLIGVSNAPLVASNATALAWKMDKTNGYSTGQTASNLSVQGWLALGLTGQATNIFGTTNVIKFIGAGTSTATNGTMVWRGDLNLYTNWVNGAILTNNGSAWLYSLNGSTLYSLAGGSPVGQYATISGANPAPLAVWGISILEDGIAHFGAFSLTNILAISNSIVTNVLVGATNIVANATNSGNFIATTNGVGTNTTIFGLGFTNGTGTNLTVYGLNSTNLAAAAPGNFILSGSTANVAALASYQGTNVITPSATTNNLILGGGKNLITAGSVLGGVSYQNTILNGGGNTITNGVGGSTIAGGYGNTINGFNTSGNDFIAGGANTIIVTNVTPFNPAGSTNYANYQDANIILGYGNYINAKRGIIIGYNGTITNYGCLLLSDGYAISTTTNYQLMAHYAGGYQFLGGPAEFPGGVTVNGAGALANGSTIPWTNSATTGLTVTNLGDAANTNLTGTDINGNLFRIAIGSGLSYNAASKTLSAPGGGGGGFPLSGDADIGGYSLTNGNKGAFTNTLNIGGGKAFIDATNVLEVNTLNTTRALTVGTNGLVNVKSNLFVNNNAVATTNMLLGTGTLNASQYSALDANTNFYATLDGGSWTNLVTWTHKSTATNITAAFNGTIQTYTVTNGPDVFIGFSGANGSVSYRFITTNLSAGYATLHFPYQPKWLAGSNSVITNGVLNLTSYGGTNGNALEAAMKENQ
ncbi:MAG TPA: hypothetical protein VF607_14335, partial [Verrucomicrobiae bacterium]